MNNQVYLFAALAVTWGLIALYVYRLYRQQQRLQREVEALRWLQEREEDA